MRTQSEILGKLTAHRAELQEQFTVKSIALFGSFARNEVSENSDIDLLVEFNSPVGLFEFVALQYHLQALFGTNVDLVTPSALKHQLRDQILREAIYA